MFSTQAPIAVAVATALSFSSVAIAAPPPSPPGAGGDAAAAPSGPDPSTMSDEERLDQAKALYGEADAAFKGGDFTTALTKFEEAYNVYAPSFHLFNFNIAQAAYELGDCAKAKTAFQRFLDLVPDHPERSTAQEKLIEIERSGCAQPVTTTTPTPVVTTTTPVEDDDDAPVLTSKKEEREDASDRERDEKDAKKTHPLLLTGIVLTAVGGTALIGSAISVGLANAKAKRLADLASPGPTGFPDGNYSDDEVFNLDQTRLPGNNAATIGLLVGGAVITGVGVGLLVVGLKKQKAKRAKLGDENAKVQPAPKRPRLTGVGPALLPGGGGASASVRF